MHPNSYCQCRRNFAQSTSEEDIIQTEEEYIKIIKNCKKDDKFFIKECAVKDFAKHFKIMFNKLKDLQLSKAIVIKYDET